MKKPHIVAAGVLTLLGLFLVSTMLFASPPVGETLTVAAFTNDGTPTGKVLLQVPFVKTFDGGATLSIAIDLNHDAAYDENEIVVRDAPAPAVADWRAGFYAATTAIESGMHAAITVNGKKYEAVTEVVTHEVGTLLAIESTTDPENAMKGWGAAIAHAEEIKVVHEGVPDLDQRPAECAPTGAANSLIALVNKHGGEDLIAGDPNDFIENLKRHMNWTPANGVLPDDFVAGKNRWAAAAGVPIRTTKVGDQQGTSTVAAITAALQKGSAVEIRIRFLDPTGRRVIGGHLVTVTGFEVVDGTTYLYINDPATTGGVTEIVEIRQNELTNYGPYAEGKTLLSWGFVQTWEGHPTGELLDPMTDAEIQGIRQFAGDVPMLTVIEHNGDHILTSKLRVGNAHPPHETGEGCPEKHWHADGRVETVGGRMVSDPNPGGCGFGTLTAKPTKDIPAPDRNPTGEGTEGAKIEVRGLESLKNN